MGEIQQHHTTEKHKTTSGQQQTQKEIHPDLQQIRQRPMLNFPIQSHPQIQKMLTKPYTERDVQTAINQLKNNKSHGSDGIPGEAYKALQSWLIKPMQQILREIQLGDNIPPEWKKKQWYTFTKTKETYANAQTTDPYV